MKNPLKITLYCVIWTEEGRKTYGVPAKDRIIPVEEIEDHNALAFFHTEKEAIKYRAGNCDWKVVRARVSLDV
jgi:hypothetical protein